VREGLRAVREDLGPDALVLSTTMVAAEGWRGWLGCREVEIVAAAERVSVGRRQEPEHRSADAGVSDISARLAAAGLDPATAADVVQNIDEYRISVDHATDILAVLKQVNTDNLDVFLSGTSRGAISVVANNLIAAGISVSSAVTRGSTVFPDRLFVNDPDVPSLQPGFVQRPAHVLLNTNDLCLFTRPVDSQALFDDLTAAGVNAAIDAVSGPAADHPRGDAPL